MLCTTARESTHPPQQLRAQSRGRMKTVMTAPVYITPCRGGEVVTGATMLYTTVREATYPPQQLRAQSRGESKPSMCLIMWGWCDDVCFMSYVSKVSIPGKCAIL
ncbi:hypothetical protein E2C01_050764 [Portunus trituberculatus]|uniref:Uncharacterized protein n=1 Tax=Portunus trituberculatus TaxID=210409 RepID=A0A5B7GHT4_PORTR|nr:hypothetical protein [Portunus trituberculatus]